MQLVDRVGQTFGRLTVTGPYVRRKVGGIGRIFWQCKCECGSIILAKGLALASGNTQSCGCLKKDAVTTHAMSKTPEYRTWASMIQRCTNPNNRRFRDYGARGIKVCKRWKSFECFFEDMGKRPSSQLSLDRYPDNNGNYEPGNCRWATRSEQQSNKRTSKCC